MRGLRPFKCAGQPSREGTKSCVCAINSFPPISFPLGGSGLSLSGVWLNLSGCSLPLGGFCEPFGGLFSSTYYSDLNANSVTLANTTILDSDPPYAPPETKTLEEAIEQLTEQTRNRFVAGVAIPQRRYPRPGISLSFPIKEAHY